MKQDEGDTGGKFAKRDDVAGYGYPRTDATKTEWNTPMPEWKRPYGLLYTFPTISRGYIPAQIDQKVLDIDMSVKGNEVEVVLESTAGAKNGKLQGLVLIIGMYLVIGSGRSWER